MLSGSIIDVNKNNILVSDTSRTNNALERMRGLLFRTKLKPLQALWIEPCPSIHTFGMKYSIDIIFLDKSGMVLKVVENLLPMRIATCKKAKVSIELLAGEAEKLRIELGTQLAWVKNNK